MGFYVFLVTYDCDGSSETIATAIGFNEMAPARNRTANGRFCLLN